MQRTLTGATLALLIVATLGLFRGGDDRIAPRANPGVDTTALLVVDGSCPACRLEPAASEVRDLLDSLQAIHVRRPRLIGVAIDRSVEQGLAVLKRFGDFDEISVGSEWANTMLLEYIWRDTLAFSTVPQLLVIERHTVVDSTNERVKYSNKYIEQIIGLPSIAVWLRKRVRPHEP